MSTHLDTDEIRRAWVDPFVAAHRLGLDRGAKPQGGNGLFVLCPAHGDQNPSCSLTRGPDGTLRVRCFACELAGDVFDLVAAVERLDRNHDFPEVKRRAATYAGIHVDGATPARPRPAPPPPRRPEDESLDDETFAAIARPILHCGQLDSTAAADVAAYLAHRGLLEAAVADGWAGLPDDAGQSAWLRSLRDAAEPAQGYEPPFTREELERARLFHRDAFTWSENRLVIPWRDERGLVYSLQRRRLDGRDEPGRAPRYVFPRGRSPRLPYGVERVASTPPDVPVVVVEGAVDVLALRCMLEVRGDRAIVLGSPGVQSWRREWGQLARGRVAGVGVDADKVGQSVVRQYADDLASGGAVHVERWTPPPPFKDWGEAWQTYRAGRAAA